MRRMIIVCFFGLIFATPPPQTLYFLNEQDFLSGQSVAKPAVNRRAYIQAEYSDDDVLKSLYFYDKNHHLISSEIYLYTDDGLLFKKQLFNEKNQLTEETIFGEEENAVRFIQYDLGVDVVKKWGDRYTKTIFRPKDSKRVVHQFYDVDGKYYGNIGYLYADDGSQTAEIWIHEPSKQIIRRWDHSFNKDTGLKETKQFDRDGRVIEQYWEDLPGREDVFQFITPLDSSIVQDGSVSYVLNNPLKSGIFLWILTDSSSSTADTTIFHFSTSISKKALYTDVSTVALMDDSIYELQFKGVSERGKEAIPKTVSRIRIDHSAPDVTMDVSPFVADTKIKFTSSESLSFAAVTWTPLIDGSSQTAITIPLTRNDLNQSGKGVFLPENSIELEDGTEYAVSMIYSDFLGNQGEVQLNHPVRCDVTKPVIKIESPVNSLFYTDLMLHYELSEPLRFANVMVANGQGYDINIQLADSLLSSGKHQTMLPYQDSTVYTIQLTGSDLADNAADAISVSGIVVDYSSPLITITEPKNGSYINSLSVFYSLSENLKSGNLQWIAQEEGLSKTIPFANNELTEDEHAFFRMDDFILSENIPYTLKVTGSDFAGNEAKPIILNDIIYDTTNPIIEITYPKSGESMSQLEVDFLFSEPIKFGEISWIESSTDSIYHRLVLSEIYLNTKDTSSIALNDTLVSGLTYYIRVTGEDLAGNKLIQKNTPEIVYDTSLPELIVQSPSSGERLNHITIDYSLSEEIISGGIQWIDESNGSVDKTIEFTGEYLSAGTHQLSVADVSKLDENVFYQLYLFGTDKAKNTCETVLNSVRYDFTRPEMTILSPGNNSAVNQSIVTYILSEPLTSGKITWETPESDSLIERPLTFLSEGRHDYLQFEHPPELRDGAEYSLSISGEDSTGNKAVSNRITNILYDITPPEIQFITPADSLILNNTVWEWVNSETLSLAKLSFHFQVSGDSISFDLDSTHLSAGVILYPLQNELKDRLEGKICTVRLTAEDPAGNGSASSEVRDIILDTTLPVVEIVSPKTNDAVNHAIVECLNSEDLASAELMFTRLGNVEEANQIIELTEPLLGSGVHQINRNNAVNLRDSSFYSINYVGTDFAGNTAVFYMIDSVYYDESPPVITIENGVDGDWIRSADILFHLSESVEYGEIRWIERSGNDSLIIKLDSNNRSKGRHQSDDIQKAVLVDGYSYDLIMLGTDPAGNQSIPTVIKNLHYDISPPVFSGINLSDSTVINSIDFQYQMSEDLQQGSVMFYTDGSVVDQIQLSSDECREGMHQLNPDVNFLIDGTDYDISFFAVDSAGNHSDTVSFVHLRYDITSPQISILSPQPFEWMKTKDLTYSISEDLAEGRIVWRDLATLSEVVYDLSSEASKAGDHQLTDYFQPSLMDGRSYSISITGEDAAGNVTDPVTVQPIHYDISPPVFSHLSFTDNSFIRDTEFSYAVSEPLLTGFIEIVPQVEESFQVNLLESGINIPMKDGKMYDISFFGTDSAGNASDTLSVNNVFYDVSPPNIVLTSPLDNSLYNENRIAYSVDEPLVYGTIIWLNEQDTIRSLIEGKYLTTGEHQVEVDDVLIREKTDYALMIEGIDRAGNKDTTNVVSSVSYDFTRPVVEYLTPYNSFPVNTIDVHYALSEDLGPGSIRWEAQDTKAYPTVVYELSESELIAGEHHFSPEIDIADSVTYIPTFIGEDIAGNVLKTIPEKLPSVRLDRKPPVITVIGPTDSLYTNKIDISYELNESLLSGTITFDYVGGLDVKDSVHIVHLKGSRLQKGTRGGILPASVMNLQSGGIYNLTFAGLDSAGNEAQPITIYSVEYDRTDPVVTLLSPMPKQAISEVYIKYTSSESLKSGKLIFKQTEGTVDPNSPKNYFLKESELTSGAHDIPVDDNIQLVEGGVYQVVILGTDLAGNVSEPFAVNNILYDTISPIFQITSPIEKSFVNSMTLDVMISELLKEGSIIAESEETTVSIPLNEDERKSGAGLIDITDSAQLISGEVYTLKLTGTDFADNLSDTVQVSQVMFDTIPPVLSISRPIDSEMISEASIDYFCSEPMGSITVVFTETEGSRDPGSPHRVDIPLEGLSAGLHTDVKPDLNPGLVESGIYTIQLFGFDLAGNPSDTVKVESIIFDNKPPQLQITSPKPDTILNQFQFGYSTTEALRNSECILEQIGGTIDDKSPHRLEIPSNYLIAGSHENIAFPEFNLQSGSIYRMKLFGKDYAGNPSEPVSVDSIAFDNIQPEITIQYPKPGSLLTQPEISYSLSENAVSANAVWSGSGFTYDINLTPYEMQAGSYEKIILNHQEPIFLGLPFDLTMTAKDTAGNLSRPVTVKDITFTRVLDGVWKYAGILMAVSLKFYGDSETESQTGSMEMDKKMGSKIDETIEGSYSIDYLTTPWSMVWELSTGETKRCIFEFTAMNQMRIVIGDKPPKNWNDGELLFFVHLSENQ